MEQQSDLLDAFGPVATDTWHRAIERFLKGRSLDDLSWDIEPDLTVSPLRRRDNSPAQSLGLATGRSDNSWHIAEQWTLAHPDQLSDYNTLLLDALSKGVNALELHWMWTPSTDELARVLKNVELAYVRVHCTFPSGDLSQAVQILADLPNADQWQGSLSLAQAPSPSAVLDVLETVETAFAHLRIVPLSIDAPNTDALAQSLYRASQHLDALLDAGHAPTQAVGLMRWDVALPARYFTAIAYLRAARRLWLGLLEAYGATEAVFPWIHAYTVNDTQADANRNLLVGTTQALSAVIGGVDSLLVTPSNGQAEANAFTRRMARNVQHLLQAESYLDRVVDPAAGAYYLEHLTERLSERAWQQFCTM